MDGVLRILDRESKMKDLGVQVDEKLKLGDHIHEKALNKAYSILRANKNELQIYGSLVRSHLEYAAARYHEETEKVQKWKQNWFMSIKDYHIQIV